MPTAPRMLSAHARSSSPAHVPAAMAAAPAPTNAGVFGMARPTGVPSPTQRSRLARGTPAAIDSTRCTPASATARHAPSTSPGFTAITAPSHAIGESVMSTSTNVAASSLRRASMGSTTMSSSARAHCAPNNPARRASPIFPPPTMARRVLIGPPSAAPLSTEARSAYWFARCARSLLRKIRDGIARRATEAGFEVEVGAGGVAGRADEPDDVALVDVLALADGHPRLVGVQRGEATTVVDDDDVAVAAHLPSEDDGAGLGRVDRRAVTAGDV